MEMDDHEMGVKDQQKNGEGRNETKTEQGGNVVKKKVDMVCHLFLLVASMWENSSPDFNRLFSSSKKCTASR